MHHRISAFSAVILAGLLFSGCAELKSIGAQDALTSLVSGKLGVSGDQAAGGLGSILGLCQEKLGGEFSSLSKFIPGSDSLMQKARDLGAVTGPIRDQSGLESSFSKLGMGPEMVGKFTGTLSDFVGKAGGEQPRQLLASVFQ